MDRKKFLKVFKSSRDCVLCCFDGLDCYCSLKETCRFTICFSFIIFILLLLSAIFFPSFQTSVEPKSYYISLEEFSATRSMEDINNLAALGERCLYTDSNNDTVTWLLDSIDKIMEDKISWVNHEIILQPFYSTKHIKPSLNEISSLPLYNVLLKLSSSSLISNASLMITTHYDTVCGSLNAGSTGSMVGIQLELIRNIVNREIPINYPVIFAFTNSYFAGFEGSNAIVEHDWYKLETSRFIILDGKVGKGKLYVDQIEPGSISKELSSLDNLGSSSLTDSYRYVDSYGDEFEIYSTGNPKDSLIIEDLVFNIYDTNNPELSQYKPNFLDYYDTSTEEESSRREAREGKAGVKVGFFQNSYYYSTYMDTVNETIDEGDIQGAGDTLTDIINLYILEDDTSPLYQNTNPEESSTYWTFNILGSSFVTLPLWSVIFLMIINTVFLIALCLAKCACMDPLMYNPFLSSLLKSEFKKKENKLEKDKNMKKENKLEKWILNKLGSLLGKKGLEYCVLESKRCLFLNSYLLVNFASLAIGIGVTLFLAFQSTTLHEKSYNADIVYAVYVAIPSAMIFGMLVPWYLNHIILKNCCFCAFHKPFSRHTFSEYRALRDEFQFEKYLAIYTGLSILFFFCIAWDFQLWSIIFLCYFMMAGFLFLTIIDCFCLNPFNLCLNNPKMDGHRYGIVPTDDDDELEKNGLEDEMKEKNEEDEEGVDENIPLISEEENADEEEEEEEERKEVVVDEDEKVDDDEEEGGEEVSEEDDDEEYEIEGEIDSKTNLLDADFDRTIDENDKKKKKKKKKKTEKKKKTFMLSSITHASAMNFIYNLFIVKGIRERGFYCWSFWMTIFMFFPLLCTLQCFHEMVVYISAELTRNLLLDLSIFTLCCICFIFVSVLMCTVIVPLLQHSSQSLGKILCISLICTVLFHIKLYLTLSFNSTAPAYIYVSNTLRLSGYSNNTWETENLISDWRGCILFFQLNNYYVKNELVNYTLVGDTLEEKISCHLANEVNKCQTEFVISEEINHHIPRIYSTYFEFSDKNTLNFHVEYNSSLVSTMKIFTESTNYINDVTWNQDDSITTENDFTPITLSEIIGYDAEYYGKQFNKVNVRSSVWDGSLNVEDNCTRVLLDVGIEYDDWIMSENGIHVRGFFDYNEKFSMLGGQYWVWYTLSVENPFY